MKVQIAAVVVTAAGESGFRRFDWEPREVRGGWLGQGRRISNSQQFEQVGVVPCGIEAFSFDTAFEGCFLFEQVERDAVEQGEVLRGMASAFSVQVFAEAHIEHPVQLVFDAPVLADCSVQRAASGLRLVM